MLSGYQVHATLPTSDLERARAFYEGILGLEVLGEFPAGVMYRGGATTRFAVSGSPTKNRAGHTQMAFDVTEIDSVVASLERSGVEFEDYDLPGFTTVDHIAEVPAGRAAWFKDPDGNLLALIEFARAEGDGDQPDRG